MSRWIALGLSMILVSSATAAPVPKPVLERTENERLWQQLQRGTSIELTEAVCQFLVHSESTVPFFATKLQSLTMTKKQVERAIGLLDSDNGWKGAYEELSQLDPRLAMSIEDCWALAKSDVQRRRLAGVLNVEEYEGAEDRLFKLIPPSGQDEYWTLQSNKGRMLVAKDVAELRICHSGRPKWFAETQTVTLLSRINTPAAWKLLEAMATGHKDATPTIYSEIALKYRKLGKRQPGYKPTRPQVLRTRDPKPIERVVPPTAEELRQLENGAQWNNLDYLVARESEIEACLYFLSRKPDETVAFFKTKLRPLKLEKKRADALVAQLFNEKEAEWKAAVAEFDKLDIRLAYPVADAWDLAKTDDQRTKMAMAILHNGLKDSGDIANFEVRVKPMMPRPGLSELEKYRLYFEVDLKPGLPKDLAERLSNHGISTFAPGHFDDLNMFLWNREACAIHILNAIATTEALAMITEMATGHPDAAPTRAAKDVLKRRKLAN